MAENMRESERLNVLASHLQRNHFQSYELVRIYYLYYDQELKSHKHLL